MDSETEHSGFRHTDDIDVNLEFDAIECRFEKFKNVNTILFVAILRSVGARIEGSNTFKGDIHESIRKIEEDGSQKIIGYRLFGKTFIIKLHQMV